MPRDFDNEKTPEKMYHISHTQLSIARFSGGCAYNGAHYVYNPKEDVLIRDDVLQKEQKQKEDK